VLFGTKFLKSDPKKANLVTLTTTTKTKVTKLRAKPKTISTVDIKRIHYATTSVAFE